MRARGGEHLGVPCAEHNAHTMHGMENEWYYVHQFLAEWVGLVLLARLAFFLVHLQFDVWLDEQEANHAASNASQASQRAVSYCPTRAIPNWYKRRAKVAVQSGCPIAHLQLQSRSEQVEQPGPAHLHQAVQLEQHVLLPAVQQLGSEMHLLLIHRS